MIFSGYQKLTLLDYPGHLGCTLFTWGCNFRCPFCHNASLVISKEGNPATQIPLSEIMTSLTSRIGIIEGVCITGGEPTLHKDLPSIIEQIKRLGFQIKLDTNGSNPDMIQYLIQNRLVDYIAMDIKNSIENYANTIGFDSYDLKDVMTSVDLLLTNQVPYEFRTTIVKELHNEVIIHDIGQWIKGASSYYLQQFVDSGDLISSSYHAHSKEQMKVFLQIIQNYIPNSYLRGID